MNKGFYSILNQKMKINCNKNQIIIFCCSIYRSCSLRQGSISALQRITAVTWWFIRHQKLKWSLIFNLQQEKGQRLAVNITLSFMSPLLGCFYQHSKSHLPMNWYLNSLYSESLKNKSLSKLSYPQICDYAIRNISFPAWPFSIYSEWPYFSYTTSIWHHVKNSKMSVCRCKC